VNSAFLKKRTSGKRSPRARKEGIRFEKKKDLHRRKDLPAIYNYNSLLSLEGGDDRKRKEERTASAAIEKPVCGKEPKISERKKEQHYWWSKKRERDYQEGKEGERVIPRSIRGNLSLQ